MDRRAFLSWMSISWVASSLPVAIVACSSNSESGAKPAVSGRADGFTSVGTIADLDKSGQILNEQFAGAALLVVRNPADPTAVLAVNPTCPHQGCLVNWKTERKSYACPCHQALFAADGKVLQGPAVKDLATYEAKVEGDSVLVKGK